MKSIFTSTYHYREREKKNNLENYLIEIFAFCLENDKIFCRDYLSEIGCNISTDISINTQSSYKGFGRPDIEINNAKSIILIECKIESKERTNQLKDYLKILRKSKLDNKWLIYLTKYYETKELDITESDIKYINYKWWDIYNLIDNHHSSITQQLKIFLIENDIAMNKNFKTIDLISLDSISGTISKMDEVIDSVKEHFEKNFGKLSKQSSRSSRLSEGAYYNFKSVGNPRKFHINLGFLWWWEEDETIYLTTSLWIPKKTKESKQLIQFFKHELKEWEFEESETEVNIGDYLNVNKTVATEEEQIPFMINFLKTNIDILVGLKDKNKDMFK